MTKFRRSMICNQALREKIGAQMPATFEEIQAVLDSTEFDYSDKWVVRWQFHLLDDEFDAPLARLIVSADQDNLSRLAKGFPVQIEGYRRWAHGDLGQRLRAAGLRI